MTQNCMIAAERESRNTLEDPISAVLKPPAKSARLSNSSTLQPGTASVRNSVMLLLQQASETFWFPVLLLGLIPPLFGRTIAPCSSLAAGLDFCDGVAKGDLNLVAVVGFPVVLRGEFLVWVVVIILEDGTGTAGGIAASSGTCSAAAASCPIFASKATLMPGIKNRLWLDERELAE
jgi:hypothetical protein